MEHFKNRQAAVREVRALTRQSAALRATYRQAKADASGAKIGDAVLAGGGLTLMSQSGGSLPLLMMGGALTFWGGSNLLETRVRSLNFARAKTLEGAVQAGLPISDRAKNYAGVILGLTHDRAVDSLAAATKKQEAAAADVARLTTEVEQRRAAVERLYGVSR